MNYYHYCIATTYNTIMQTAFYCIISPIVSVMYFEVEELKSCVI